MSEWKKFRIKDICDFVSRGSAPSYVDEGAYRVVNQATFSKGYLDLTNIRYTAIASPDALVRQGDLLIASTGGGVLGKVLFYADETANLYADSHVSILRSKKNSMKFLYYYFSTRYDEINAKLALGSTNQTELQRDLLLAYELPLPSLPEQDRIVSYLDEKTAAIDTQVSLLEQKAKKYEQLKKSLISHAVTCGLNKLNKDVRLKESGIDWIGQIPEHWEVKRFKYFGRTIKGKSLDYYDEPFNGSDIVLSVETLRQDTPTFYNYAQTDDSEQLCTTDDIVVIWDGAGVGEFLKSKNGILSSTIAKLKIDEHKMQKRYFWFWGGNIEYRLKSIPTGMGIPHLNPTLLNNYRLPIPPLSEQQAIADYLDKKTAEIDAAIANINQQIEKYRLLRRALINEVVTGQRAI